MGYSRLVQKTVSAENTFTDPLLVNRGEDVEASIEMSGSPVFSGTVYLQRSLDNGSTWKSYKAFTSDIEFTVTEINTDLQLRLGVRTGDYISGSVVLQLKLQEI